MLARINTVWLQILSPIEYYTPFIERNFREICFAFVSPVIEKSEHLPPLYSEHLQDRKIVSAI